MRFDLRLQGMTESGRACVMELTVYAQGEKDMLEKSQQQSTEGPWYYKGTNEPVPQTEKITVEGVEQLKDRSPPLRNVRSWLKRS
jgi:hypothetical protein